MTRTRLLVRRALVVSGLLFVALLAALYRRPGTPPAAAGNDPVAGTLVAEAGGVRDQVRFRGFDYLETRAEEGRYHLRATEVLGFEENGEQIFRLKDVLFESEESEPGRRVALSAPRAEFARISRALRVFDGVSIEGEETSLRGASFHYEPLPRTFRSDGPVTAVRGALVASAERGALESRSGAVTLEGRVRLRGRSEGRSLSVSAPEVRLTREGELAASGGVVALTDDSLLRCARLLRTPTPEGDRLEAAGGAHLVVAPRAPSLQAPLIADGESLELQRASDGSPRFLELRREGATARVLAAPGAREGARKALSARFSARFTPEGRLAELSAPGAVEGFEAGPSGLRRMNAGAARLTFLATGALDVGVFTAGVRVAEGTRSEMTAAEGTLRGADDLAVFTGVPGAPAVYRDERGTVRARVLSYARRENKVNATGDVVADYRSGAASGSGTGGSSFFGGTSADPFHSRSDALELRLGKRTLALHGKVQAWQKENVLRCRDLLLDDAARSLRAEGDVRAFLRKKPAVPAGPGPAPTPKAGSPDTLNASGDLLTHREAERLVRIEGHATIVSGNWVMTSDITDIRLGPDQQVEYAEAKGSVVLEDRGLHRRGEGKRATWRPVADVVTLEGTPAAVIDEKGNRLTGGMLTIRQGRSQVDVKPGGGVPSEGVFRPEGS